MDNTDPQIINLAKAIRQQESGHNFNAVGDNGTSAGAYQWSNNGKPLAQGQAPENFRSAAKRFLGDENAQFTPSNQNAVAYSQIKEWRDQGLNPAQIAAKWNSGSETGWENKIGTTTINGKPISYNVPQYVKNVTDYYQNFKGQTQQVQQPQVIQEQPTQSGATFASSPTDSPLQAGLKTLGNVPSSLFNFGKGVLNSINPINIAKNISEIPGAFSDLSQQQGGALNAIGATIKELPQQAYQATVPEAGRALLRGDLQTAQRAITEDPVGQIAPFLLTAQQVARKTGYGAQFDNVISKTARPAIDATKAVAQVPLNVVGGIMKSASSHLLGLEPKSIGNIISNPEAYSKLAQDQASRGGLANEFGSAIDQLEANLNEAGTAYNPIRALNKPVAVPENFIDNVFGKFGLKIVNGEVIADTKSITRNTSDIKALQNFVDNWGDKTTITPAEYLNMRKDIAGIAKFGKEIGTNLDAKVVGTELYAKANESIRPQIDGLKVLDEEYSPIRQQFDQVKKDFLKKEVDGSYTFKEGATNKIANALGTGKDALLARMEEVLPGVGQKIEILKTVEDIQKAYGNKVGNYTRGIIEGGAVLTGNIPTVIAAILTNPSIAVPLLRGLGYTWAKVQPIVGFLQMIAGDINNAKIFTSPKDLQVESQSITNQIPFTNADKIATKIPVKGIPSDYPNSMYIKPKDMPTIQMGKTPKTKSDLPVIR